MHETSDFLNSIITFSYTKYFVKARIKESTDLCEVNSPHKGPVTRKMFPSDYVIILDGIMVHVQTSNLSAGRCSVYTKNRPLDPARFLDRPKVHHKNEPVCLVWSCVAIRYHFGIETNNSVYALVWNVIFWKFWNVLNIRCILVKHAYWISWIWMMSQINLNGHVEEDLSR